MMTVILAGCFAHTVPERKPDTNIDKTHSLVSYINHISFYIYKRLFSQISQTLSCGAQTGAGAVYCSAPFELNSS